MASSVLAAWSLHNKGRPLLLWASLQGASIGRQGKSMSAHVASIKQRGGGNVKALHL